MGSQKVQVISRKVGLSTFVDTVTNTGVSTHIFVTDTRGFTQVIILVLVQRL